MTDAPDPNHNWLSELPLTPGPPELQLGTRALSPDEWLVTDANTEDELRLRRQLLATHGDLVQSLDDVDAATSELVGLLGVRRTEPLSPAGTTAVDHLGEIARTIPEDVFVMDKRGNPEGWRLVAGALVFPNHWRLSDKLGLPMGEIHAPVDGYDELLARRVDRVFDRLAPARPVWRRNFFVHDHPELFAPGPVAARPIDDVDEVDELWIRSERQVLWRLAFSGMIVFTVKTQIAPMSAIAARPEVAEAMIRFIEAAGPRSLETTHLAGRDRAIADHLWRSIR